MNRLFRLLLALYPKEFREEYGREMTLAFRDRWNQQPGLLTALSTLADTLATAVEVHAGLLAQDLRYAARALVRDLGFSLPAVGTLALGIGAATAMFTLVWAVLLRPLPFDQPDRVVSIADTNSQLRIQNFASSLPNLEDWSKRARLIERFAAFRYADFNLNGAGERSAERVKGLWVQPGFWQALGQQPIAGRLLRPDDSAHVAVLGQNLWLQRFNGDRSIIGRAININGAARTVIGVAPSSIGLSNDAGLFLPLIERERNRGDRNAGVVGRLAPGVSAPRAGAELNAIAAALEAEYPQANRGWRTRVLVLSEWLVEPSLRRGFGLLLAAVGLLLIIACVNVASLLLARAATRAQEVSIRLSLGASRARLVRQFATESLVLGAIGGLAGIACSLILLKLLVPFLPDNLPGIHELELEPPVLAFSLALTLAATLLFGAAPAWQGIQLARAPRQAPVRRWLVAGQLALATVLVVGALLMISTFRHLVTQNLGFRQDHLLTARFNPPPDRPCRDLCQQLVAEARSLPGVTAAGLTSEIPFGPVTTEMPVIAAERADAISRDGIQTNWRIVTDGYLAALGVPLLQGRWWAPNENLRPRPILISHDLSKRLWTDGRDPIGQRVRLGNGLDFTIIGVTGDLRHLSLTATRPTATMYFPIGVFTGFNMSIVVRTAGDPALLASALREAVRRVDPQQPVFDIRTMETHVGAVASAPRLAAILLGTFAALASLLGVVGVAGLVAYSVAGQRREFAIRLAIGATAQKVITSVAGSHFRLCAAGLAAGIAAAWAARSVLSSLLFGVRESDPAYFAAALGLLGAAALAACLLPALRIARIDPAAILRGE